jgi:hypothetical protein
MDAISFYGRKWDYITMHNNGEPLSVFLELRVAAYQENELSDIVTVMGFYSYKGEARSSNDCQSHSRVRHH